MSQSIVKHELNNNSLPMSLLESHENKSCDSSDVVCTFSDIQATVERLKILDMFLSSEGGLSQSLKSELNELRADLISQVEFGVMFVSQSYSQAS